MRGTALEAKLPRGLDGFGALEDSREGADDTRLHDLTGVLSLIIAGRLASVPTSFSGASQFHGQLAGLGLSVETIAGGVAQGNLPS